MTRQTDEKSLYEQQEDRILAQSDEFIDDSDDDIVFVGIDYHI